MKRTITLLFLLISLGFSTKVNAQADAPFLGEIIIFAGNFAPRGWAFCEGQLLAISSNTALFSILGTTYGGDGRTTFALPDLRGRAPIHLGRGSGLSSYKLGSRGGVEQVTLPVNQISVSIASGSTQTKSIEVVEGRQAHLNMQPYIAVNYIIAIRGIYPSRN